MHTTGLGSSSARVTRTGSFPEPVFLQGGKASLLMSQHPPTNKSICTQSIIPLSPCLPLPPHPLSASPPASPAPAFPSQASSLATLPLPTGAAHPQTPCSSHHTQADPNFKAFLYPELIQETLFSQLPLYCCMPVKINLCIYTHACTHSLFLKKVSPSGRTSLSRAEGWHRPSSALAARRSFSG